MSKKALYTIESGAQTSGVRPPVKKFVSDCVWKIAETLVLLNPTSMVRNLRHSLREEKGALPIPNYRARFLVAGTTDIPHFLELGQRGFDCILNALERNKISIDSIKDVLDFGCGCGRVLRYWSAFPEKRIHGTDLSEFLVASCRLSVPFAQVDKNELQPKLKYGDGSFDLIYAYSVFTHLDVETQKVWMTELYRLLRPGGILIMSSHGQAYIDSLTELERRSFAMGLPVIRATEHEGKNRCASFLPTAYVVSDLGCKFETIEVVPEGSKGTPKQDLYVFKRSTETSNDNHNGIST